MTANDTTATTPVAESAADQIQISLFGGARDTAPNQLTVTRSDLMPRLTTHVEREAKDGAGFSPTVYREGATRGRHGVEVVTALVQHGRSSSSVREWGAWAGRSI